MSTSEQSQSPQTPPPVVQQTVIMMGQNTKSAALAFILALIFGPFGLLYATISGGITMLVIDLFVAVFTFGVGLFFTNVICAVWALSAVNSHNKKMSQPQQFHQVIQQPMPPTGGQSFHTPPPSPTPPPTDTPEQG